MERVTIDALAPDDLGGTLRRDLATALSTTDLAVNHYDVPPAGRLPGGLHAHADQEELFVVVEGTATFETYRDGTGEAVTVAAGELVRFAPGEFQSGRNDADEPLVVLALGAPREITDVRLPLVCPACDRRDVRLDEGRLVYPDCGTTREPAPCPDCGAESLDVTLGSGDDPVIVCRDCGSSYESPPTQ
jgi:mannose-6-phosphate isomerase-like protein (cupin superfamily)